MADYYPLLSRAVGALTDSSADARRSIYERARKALVGQLQAIQPPIAEADIARETDSLDEAVARIEAEIAGKAAAETAKPPTGDKPPTLEKAPEAPPKTESPKIELPKTEPLKTEPPKGALGPMQLMPETARAYGVADICNPAQNIRGGVRYLRDLLSEFGGDEMNALAAFNAGPQAVYRHKGVPPFKETALYVVSIMNRTKTFRGKTAASAEAPAPDIAAASGWTGGQVLNLADEREGSNER